MDVFERFFGRSNSASTAKKRLQVVLTQDRTNISTETLDKLKDEIILSISKYVVIDSASVEVAISNGANGNNLTVNIPVVSSRHVYNYNKKATESRKF